MMPISNTLLLKSSETPEKVSSDHQRSFHHLGSEHLSRVHMGEKTIWEINCKAEICIHKGKTCLLIIVIEEVWLPRVSQVIEHKSADCNDQFPWRWSGHTGWQTWAQPLGWPLSHWVC